MEATVSIFVQDDVDPFTRVTGPSGDTFRNEIAPHLFTEQDVLTYWSDLCLFGGVQDVSHVTGWRDIPHGSVTMSVA